ncbi:hypothetical protein EI94DRAFT_1706903 [Lactarius quietus]|nr:hypothetical protein EI94DRAFT_1706903 [Lactarius quietus]
MKEHYEDLLTYNPQGLMSNHKYWANVDLGEVGPEMVGLNEGFSWPEILLTIRGMNHNTAPGKDEVHINVHKIMCEGSGLLCAEQASFCLCEEAVAQATALAKIVQRHFLEGRSTVGPFINFKKAYDRVFENGSGVIYKNQDTIPGNTSGVIVSGWDLMQCNGLMYADDVVVLSDSVEGTQWGIKGLYNWGQNFRMDLGCNKCGMLLWKGKKEG